MPGELGVQVLQLLGELLVAARFACLTLQRADLPLHFAHEIGHAQQILLGIFQFAQGLSPLRLVLRDARRLLENQPPVFRFAGEDLRDVALGHDAVARAAHAGAHEQLLDVFEPAGSLVDEILAPAIPEDPARDRHLIVGQLDARRRQVLVVHPADRQRDLRHAQRFAPVGAVKDHVRHLAATQCLGRLLTQHPTDSVRHVGLAAAIGANDARHPRLEIQRCLVCERLKS